MMSKVKKKNGQNLLTAKAYNGRCILSWLSDCLLTALDSHQNNEMLILYSDAMTLNPELEGSPVFFLGGELLPIHSFTIRG